MMIKGRRPDEMAGPLEAWYLPTAQRPEGLIITYEDAGDLVLSLTTPARAVFAVELILSYLVRAGANAELAAVEEYVRRIKVARRDAA